MQKTIEKENYLKTLYKLEEKSQLATVTSLANHFKVSKSTVSNMIKKLMLMKLVDTQPYKPILLTNNGKKTAVEVISKHRLIELYLYEKMQFKLDEVHEIAEEIETEIRAELLEGDAAAEAEAIEASEDVVVLADAKSKSVS